MKKVRLTTHTFLQAAFFILISLAAGWIGSLATMPAIETWYATLNKPAWTPPNYVFGPVWTLLYVLMGYAAFLVSQSKKAGKTLVLWFFIAHLAVNTLWSVSFFGIKDLLLAQIIIILLLGIIVLLTALFFRYSRAAGWLMVPYVLWVTYASTLNAGVLFLN